MKIVVTGGRGTLGMNLIIKLVSMGHDVISIDRKYKPNTSIEGVRYITEDINNILNLNLKDIDFIYHLAVVGVDKISSFENPNNVFKNIVVGTNSIIEFSIKNKCKLIFCIYFLY
jgi:nucleoside-diphosphate-sugar epimerase